MIQTRRYRDYAATPWRNGGGITREIARSPSDHPIGFLWRVSLAEVGADGPFSEFPGVTRTLAILSGKGMKLDFGNGEVHVLTPETQPLTFSGARPAFASLIDGPVVDLNAMSSTGPLEIIRKGHRYDVTFDDGRGISIDVVSATVDFDCLVTERNPAARTS